MEQRCIKLPGQPDRVALLQQVHEKTRRKRHVAAENLVRTLPVQEHLAAMLLGQICDLPPYVGALSRKWLIHVVDGFAIVLADARFRETRSFQLELRIGSQEIRNEFWYVYSILCG